MFDTSKQLDPSSPHTIITDQVQIALQLKGVIAGFVTRKHTQEELEGGDNIQITMPASTACNQHCREIELAEEQAGMQDSLDGGENRICAAFSTMLYRANDDGLVIEGVAQEATTCKHQDSLTEVLIAEGNQLATRLISQVQVWGQ